ncbi:hypothetical protein GCM10012285_24890 [Streptomyces kronopolitis]|uniref:N-acetyltransferase domain-containing protein n=1 Tax=Streptomyces kronopolitis TaxID=1612435 RepID=A0ABQ2JCZ8_9ACTN|nr:hypothetical protein GCM10012285_24890 [Streptomyces kronopolitis]
MGPFEPSCRALCGALGRRPADVLVCWLLPGTRSDTPHSPGARLGRVLIAPAARGRGLGETLVTLTVERAFGELGLPLLDLGVWAHNTPARRIYEKLGFPTQRITENVVEVDGVPWATVRMRLTSPDR